LGAGAMTIRYKKIKTIRTGVV